MNKKILVEASGQRPGVVWDGDCMRFWWYRPGADLEQLPVDKVEVGEEPAQWLTLQLALTDRCNINCKYCQVRSNALAPRDQDMDKSVLLQALESFIAGKDQDTLDRSTIILTGGEVTLVPELVEAVVDWLAETCGDGAGPRLIVNTNAISFPQRFCAALQRWRERVYVIVSVDGSPEFHDRNRLAFDGSGTAETVAAGIERLHEQGFGFGITAVATGESVHSLPEFAEYIITRFRPLSLGLNLVHRRGLDDSELERADAGVFARGMLEADVIARRLGIYLEQANRLWKPLLARKPRIRDCQAGQTTIAVLPEGVYTPCYTLPRLESGTCQEVGSGIDFGNELFETWRSRTSLTIHQCAGCAFRLMCGGGCPLDAELAAGDLMQVDPRVCKMVETAMTWIGEKLVEGKDTVAGDVELVGMNVLTELASGGGPGGDDLQRPVNH